MRARQRLTQFLRGYGAVGAAAILAVLAGPRTAAAQERAVCEVRLTVEVSPSVPQASMHRTRHRKAFIRTPSEKKWKNFSFSFTFTSRA